MRVSESALGKSSQATGVKIIDVFSWLPGSLEGFARFTNVNGEFIDYIALID